MKRWNEREKGNITDEKIYRKGYTGLEDEGIRKICIYDEEEEEDDEEKGNQVTYIMRRAESSMNTRNLIDERDVNVEYK